MNVLRLAALVAALIPAAAAAESPAVADLAAKQVEPPPASDPPGPVTFRVAVTARCGDADAALTVAAMLGDTLTAWQPPADDGTPTELALTISRRELGFEQAPLCRRRADAAPGEAVLPGAFAMQVFARCDSGDGRASQRTASVPLAIRYSCPGRERKPDDGIAAPPAPAD